MELTAKHIQILNYLLQQVTYTSYRQLADRFQITDRMARKHVDALDAYFREKGTGSVERRYGLGVRVKVQPEFHTVKAKPRNPEKGYSFNKQERGQLLLIKLLLESRPVLQKELYVVLGVSPSTMTRELENLARVLEPHGLIIRKNRVTGVQIQGPENLRRQALYELLRKGFTLHQLQEAMDPSRVLCQSPILLQILGKLPDRGRGVLQGIELLEKWLSLEFTDSGLLGLFLHSVILLVRTLAGAEPLGPVSWDRAAASPELNAAVHSFILMLQREYAVALSPADRDWLTCLVGNTGTLRGCQLLRDRQEAIARLSREMIGIYEQVAEVRFGSQEETLRSGLVSYLQHLVADRDYPIPIAPREQTLLPGVDHSCSVYTKMTLGVLEEYLGRRLGNQEIHPITACFGAAQLRLDYERKKNIRLLLVCDLAGGIADLLSAQIRQQFHVEITVAASRRQFASLNRGEYSLVVSTIPLENLGPGDYVRIQPEYTREDQKNIELALGAQGHRSINLESAVALSKDLAHRLCSRTSQLSQQQLQYEILDELVMSRSLGDRENKRVLNIWDVLSETAISLRQTLSGPEEAIRRGVELLEQTGAVDSSYADGILENVRNFGGYMAIMPRVFLAHAENKRNVHSVAFSVLTLAEPICFGSDTCDPIQLVITFAATDTASHLPAMAQLLSFLRSADAIDRLLTCKTRGEVYQQFLRLRKKGQRYG